MHAYGLIKVVGHVGLIALTLYAATYIVQYGLLMLICLILLILGALLVGSLLYVYMDGANGTARLWSLSREQRQLYHAQNLPIYSLIPIAPEAGFREWNEYQWRELADTTGDELSRCIKEKRAFLTQVDGCLVRNGWPSVEEVERCDNTIVLTIRDNWAGLAARVNPVLNAFLNRFLKCWNRSLIRTSIRFSSYGMPYPVVSMDFPTADVSTLNFGQKDDCLLMSYVYERVREMYPKAKIILLSICLGGLRILNWLSRNPNPENVAAVVLESPLASLRHMMIGSVGKWATDAVYRLFCMHVPNFRPELENEYSYFRDLKPSDNEHPNDQICNVPLFVGILESDPYSNRTHLPLLRKRFPKLTIFASEQTVLEEKQLLHGMLYKLPEYRLAVRNFLSSLHTPKKLV